MQSIHIIATDDIIHHLTYIVASLGLSGVEDDLSVVCERHLRVPDGDMALARRLSSFRLSSEGIDPCMQFHAPFMSLCNHPCQRIPVGLRCPTLFCCEEAAPRFQVALVEGITFRSDLEDDGVDPILLQFIELIRESVLHLLSGHSDELSVDALYPCSSKFAFSGTLFGSDECSLLTCREDGGGKTKE